MLLGAAAAATRAAPRFNTLLLPVGLCTLLLLLLWLPCSRLLFLPQP